MKAGVAELKAGLSRYLDRVRARHEVVVTDRGQPVAKIVPTSATRRVAERGARGADVLGQLAEALTRPNRLAADVDVVAPTGPA